MDITTHLYINYFKSLTQDLLFTSESDYPWKVVYLGRDEKEMMKQMPFDIHAAKKLAITDLLRNALKTQDWYVEAELATVRQYQHLVKTLQEEVTNVNVYKFGEIEIAVYILLQLPNSEYLGLSTIAVET